MSKLERALNAASEAAAIINAEGHNSDDIFDCIRRIKRQIQIDGARSIKDLPEIELHKIGRSPVNFDPRLWENESYTPYGKP